MCIKGGYILQPRAIDESDVSKFSPHIREIWLYLLRKAEYKDTVISGTKVKRGQVLTSYSDISEDLAWYVGFRKGVYNLDEIGSAMKTLRRTAMITTARTARKVLITICKYEYYQDPDNYDNRDDNRSDNRNDNRSDNRTITKELKKERIEDTNVSIKSNNKVVSTNIDFDKLVDFFNSETKGVFGNVRKPISKKRERLVSARIKEHGKDAFVEVIKKAMRSNFLKGDSGKFIMTFDWMILPTNFEKILSDNFKNRDGYKESGDGDKELADAIRRGIERGISQNSI